MTKKVQTEVGYRQTDPSPVLTLSRPTNVNAVYVSVFHSTQCVALNRIPQHTHKGKKKWGKIRCQGLKPPTEQDLRVTQRLGLSDVEAA